MATGGTAITPEETNHLRLVYLSYVIAQDAVRSYFDSIHTNLANDLARDEMALKRIHVIKQFQLDQLFPGGKPANVSTDFDITLLICLLRNMHPKVTAPPLGFDQKPNPQDKGSGAHMAMIKHYRNKLAHSKDGKISDTEFNTIWTEMEGAINGLTNNKFLKKIKEVKYMIINGDVEGILASIVGLEHEHKLTTQQLQINISELERSISDTNKTSESQTEEIKHVKEEVQRLDRNVERHSKEIKDMKEIQASAIPVNIQEQSDHTLAQWTEENKNFIDRHAVQKVLLCVKQNHSVTVIGSSGTGKTALMRLVACMMKDEGYIIISTTKPDDIRDLSRQGVKMLFVFDDVCGNYSLNMYAFEMWSQKCLEIASILERYDSKIISTCRLEIFNDMNFQKLSVLIGCVCNLSAQDLELNRKEKFNIASASFDEYALRAVESLGEYDCFPFLCSLFKRQESCDVENFITNPFKFYEIELNIISSGNDEGKLKFCCLAMCVVYNNSLTISVLSKRAKSKKNVIEDVLDECELNGSISRKSLIRAARNLLGTYFKQDYNDRFVTVHGKLFDFLSCYMGNKMLKILIKYAPTVFINERLVCGCCTCKVCKRGEFDISVTDTHFDAYVQRLSADLLDSKISHVLSKKNLTCPSISNCLLKSIQSLSLNKQKELINMAERLGRSILFHSCAAGNLKFTKWLLHIEADINKTDGHITSCLHIAASKGHTDVVCELLKEYSTLIDSRNINGETPLYLACENGHLNVVKTLLLKGADFKVITRLNENTCLCTAASNGHTEVVCELLKECSTLIDSRNINGETPLYLACTNGHVNVVKTLLLKGADFKVITRLHENSCLCTAASNGHTELVRELLQKDLNQIDSPNMYGKTPLYLACENGHVNIVKELSLWGPDFKVIDKYSKQSCLHVAALYGHIDVVRELLKNKSSQIDINSQDTNGDTPLLLACESGQLKIVKELTLRGASVNIVNNEEDSPLHKAGMSGKEDIADELLKNDTIAIDVCNKEGVTPLHIACSQGFVKVVDTLILKGASIAKIDTDGETPLHYAVFTCNKEAIYRLLKEDNINIDVCDNHGYTPLHYACTKGLVKVVDTLIQEGASVAKVNEHGDSPLHCAVKRGNKNTTFRLLKENNIDIDACNNQGKTPLHVVLQLDDSDGDENFDYLDFFDDDVSESDSHDDSHSDSNDDDNSYSQGLDNIDEIALAFIARSADVNKCDSKGRSPLLIASGTDHLLIVQELLKHEEIDVNVCDQRGNTPLQMARREGNPGMVAAFLSNASHINGEEALQIDD